MSLIATSIVQLAELAAPMLLKAKPRGIKNLMLPNGTQLSSTYDIVAMSTIEEHHYDEMTFCTHPIENGANITDHMYKEPARVQLSLGWSNSPNNNDVLDALGIAYAFSSTLGGDAIKTVIGIDNLFQAGFNLLNSQDKVKDAYNNLVYLQVQKVLFDLYTGKRIYSNMACKSIETETDYTSDNSLIVKLELQEIILAQTKKIDIQKLPNNYKKQYQGTKSLVQK